ncbi:hypothetical protein H8959_009167 [Pygathrix nigripes]
MISDGLYVMVDRVGRKGSLDLMAEKYVLCGYCYEKVHKETAEIKRQIEKQEGGPFKAPTIETMVLYTGETPSEQDQGKRIIERDRKRPSWFTQN